MGASVGKYGPLAADTVFLGGGTPSLLTGEQMKRLMAELDAGKNSGELVDEDEVYRILEAEDLL